MHFIAKSKRDSRVAAIVATSMGTKKKTAITSLAALLGLQPRAYGTVRQLSESRLNEKDYRSANVVKSEWQ